jgi:protein-arginine kinase activator protein McsA
MRVTKCPECGGRTKLVERQTIWNDEMRHTRVCTDCPVEYVASYSNPVNEEINNG